MKTLKQLLDERDVDTELAIHAVKEWLQQKRFPENKILNDKFRGYNMAINGLLEEVEE